MKMKIFNLEAAKNNAPLVTRDGRKARVVCFDMKVDECPLIGLVEEEVNGKIMEKALLYREDGTVKHQEHSEYDLFMAVVKKRRWVNLFEGNEVSAKSYETEEEAKAQVEDYCTYIATVPVEWEE